MYKKFYVAIFLLALFESNLNASSHIIKIGTNYESFYNLCPGDTLKFTGDSLNMNVYGSIQGFVYNSITHTNDNFSIISYYNLETTYIHIVTAGDSSYYYGTMQPSLQNGGLYINCTITSILHKNINKNLIVYPNPTNSVLNISDAQNLFENSTIEIVNFLGQNVLFIAFQSQIDISKLESGIYTLKIKDDTGNFFTAKILKQE